MDDYIKTCKPTRQEDCYMSLIKGVRTVHDKLCKDGDFRKGTYSKVTIYMEYFELLFAINVFFSNICYNDNQQTLLLRIVFQKIDTFFTCQNIPCFYITSRFITCSVYFWLELM
jgi:hypothetical protein